MFLMTFWDVYGVSAAPENAIDSSICSHKFSMGALALYGVVKRLLFSDKSPGSISPNFFIST